MAFVQVSASVQTTGASSLSPSLTGVVSGNSLVYGISMWHASAPASTPPTDYTEVFESAASDGAKAAQGYRLSAPSGTNTPSIGLTASSWGRAYLLEYDTLDTPEANNTGTGSSTAPSSGAITVGGTTSIAIGVMTGTSDPITITPNGSWTQRAESENQSAGQAINIEEITGVSGSQTATWTTVQNGPWAAGVASYPPGSAPPASIPELITAPYRHLRR